jgi:hypothetical protein
MPYEPLTHEELAAIAARAEAATPGPWKSEMGNVYPDSPEGEVQLDYMAVAYDITREDNDGPFIAHARTDIPRLLATIERLRKDALDWLDDYAEAKRSVIGETSDAPDRDIAEFEGGIAKYRKNLEVLR